MELDLTLDPQSLTLEELSTIEELAGEPVTKVLEDLKASEFSAKEMVAIVYVIGKRSDPTLTLEAVRALKLSDIEVIAK